MYQTEEEAGRAEAAINTQRQEIATDPVELAPEQVHEGEQLKKYIKDQHISIYKMAAILGVSSGGLSMQLKRAHLTSRFKRKLSEIGLHSFKDKDVYTTMDEIIMASSTTSGSSDHEGEQLKRYMNEQHLTAAEMAKILGVNIRTVYLQSKRPYLSAQFKKKLWEIGIHSFGEKAVYTPKGEQELVRSFATGTPVHEGEQLKKYMLDNRLACEDMANILNVSRQAVYLQTKRPYLSPQFRKNLSGISDYSIHPSAISIPSIKEPDINANEREKLIQEIKRLQNIVVLQAEHIRQMGKLVPC